MRSSLVVAFFALAALGPIALIACSNGDDDADTGGSEDDIKKKKLGLEGAACNDAKKCAAGLLCKPHSSAPPPGAVGMPLPSSSSTSSGPPPGAMGMPLPPQDGTCQKPAPGELGGTCSASQACNAGLDCIYPSSGSSTSGSGGPPPGALGMPLPSSTSTSSGPPPGALGLPIMPTGTCKASTGSSTSGSGGPPPGAVGLPLPPHS